MKDKRGRPASDPEPYTYEDWFQDKLLAFRLWRLTFRGKMIFEAVAWTVFVLLTVFVVAGVAGVLT